MKTLYSVLSFKREPKKYNLVDEIFYPTEKEALIGLNKEKERKIGWEFALSNRSVPDDRVLSYLSENRTADEALNILEKMGLANL